MLSNPSRYLLIIVLLLIALGLTWGQRESTAARLSAELPSPPESTGDSGMPPPAYVYFVDVEGWYRITPHETVVRSPYDLSAANTEALAEALPGTLGEWQQVGQDEFIADDPAVVYYLRHPTIALQRTFQDPTGLQVTLAAIGNKGEDSFLLFSHTPETCYPGQLWQVVDSHQVSALLDVPSQGSQARDRPMYAQYLLTEHALTGQRLMVLYWYLWDNPQRDSKEGVLSMRVNLLIPPDRRDQEILDRGWDFVRELFPSTLPWERFGGQ
jgi:hypothetical protein